MLAVRDDRRGLGSGGMKERRGRRDRREERDRELISRDTLSDGADGNGHFQSRYQVIEEVVGQVIWGL